MRQILKQVFGQVYALQQVYVYMHWRQGLQPRDPRLYRSLEIKLNWEEGSPNCISY